MRQKKLAAPSTPSPRLLNSSQRKPSMIPADSKRFEHDTLVAQVSDAARRVAEDDPRPAMPRAGSNPSVVARIRTIQLHCSVRPTRRILLNEIAIIGRLDKHDSIPYDARMSRQHFSIELNEHGAFVEDLHSTNGTWLNGNRIKRSQLAHRDQIVSGMTVFEVELIER